MHREMKEFVGQTRVKADRQATRTFSHPDIHGPAHPKSYNAALIKFIANDGNGCWRVADEELDASIRKYPYIPRVCVSITFHGTDQLHIWAKDGNDIVHLHTHLAKIYTLASPNSNTLVFGFVHFITWLYIE